MSFDPVAAEHRRTIREAEMAAAEATALAELPEHVRVEQWRWDCLTDALVGFDAAHVLSRSQADLHVILAAKAAGCSDGLLLEIFG